MSDRLEVSVVIPTHNNAEYLGEAIGSVLNQTYRAYEIIVVDDGSEDDTQGLLEAYSECVKVVTQANRGPSVARNAGIRAAQSEFVALLDADDIWQPDKLEEQVSLFEGAPDLGVCFTNYSIFGAPLPYSSGFDEVRKRFDAWPRRRVTELGYRLEVPSLFEEFIRHGTNPCITSTVMCRRSCFDVAGLFDESYSRPAVEDIHLWLRLAKYFRFGFVDKILMARRYSESKLRKPDSAERRAFGETINMLELLHNWIPLSNAERKVVRSRVAEYHLAAGYFELTRYNRAAAWCHLWASFRKRPGRRATYYLVLSAFPSGVVRHLRKLRHRLTTVFGLRV